MKDKSALYKIFGRLTTGFLCIALSFVGFLVIFFVLLYLSANKTELAIASGNFTDSIIHLNTLSEIIKYSSIIFLALGVYGGTYLYTVSRIASEYFKADLTLETVTDKTETNMNSSRIMQNINLTNLEWKELGKMGWNDAQKACDQLGQEWRILTIEEFLKIYNDKKSKRLLSGKFYWTSSEVDRMHAWVKDISYGTRYVGSKGIKLSVLCIRDYHNTRLINAA